MKRLVILSICFLLFSFTAISKTYIIVTGSLEDATAWYKVKAALEKENNRVIVVNRLTYGKHNPNVTSATLDKYVAQVIDSVNVQSEKVILVGHSFGGLLISAVAEKIPHKISCLVYVAAIIPQTNDSASSFLSKDKSSKISSFLNISDDKTYGWINQNNLKILCSDCSEEDIAYYKLSITDKYEPLTPFSTPVVIGNNFNSVPKIIIQAILDQAISYEYQQQYVRTAKNVKQVYQINSSHLPNLSKAKELSKLLLEVN